MEALLPSEIARLVLGYLEDQKCTEAAKLFLETSPHLQECRTVLSLGRRFSTRVSGLTLMDVVEKFSAISAMIQERLNKVADCEQLKHCGDLMEQLKFLVEEPRGQRFVVNINVPSQNNTQTSNGSPIIASSIRKRRHSNSERIKRTIRSQSNTMQQLDVIMSPPSCHNVDTTPLESLPGNADSSKQVESSISLEKEDDSAAQEMHIQCDFNKSNSTNRAITCERNNSTRRNSDDVWSIRNCEIDIEDKRKETSATSTESFKRCTAATNTEELLSFSSAEVQTTPYEIPESESESNDEPIENLSILTKEILNRTELQECIAENINRGIIPTDLSLRDEILNESVGEGNTSMMTELNNAIKSIVEATETDPVFEKFLDEIIGPHTETDTSPEEDGEGKSSPKSPNDAREKQAEPGLSNVSSPEPTIADIRASAENDTPDVPLKHRLRSSSRQQNNRIEDEVDKIRDQEKEQNALEDQNAAAILSIINANITNNTLGDKRIPDPKVSTVTSDDNRQKGPTISAITVINKDDAILKPLISGIQRTSGVAASTSSNVEPKIKKSTVKRPRPTKLKRDQAMNNQLATGPELVPTMPTLVVCSKEEINNILTINNSSIRSTSTSRFIPIAPKDPSRTEEPVQTLYLKTVNIAQKMPIARTLPAEGGLNNSASQTLQSQKKSAKTSKKLKTVQNKIDTTAPVEVDDQQVLNLESLQTTGKIVGGESITLYGNESSARTLLDGTNIPTINLDENISLSESGLSPYLKFNCSKSSQNHNLSDIDMAPMLEGAKNATVNNNNFIINEQQSMQQISKNAECDIVAKRTPKSLLKSRTKNCRLSLSTPRKRNSHIRTLDFSTPPKVINSTRKTSGNATAQFSSTSVKRLKSVCRTSLFKSPPFSNSTGTMPAVQKQKSPMKVCHQSYKIPIATRSPAPKLMGGWDKCNGVGVIIGDVSSHGSTSASSSSEDRVQHRTCVTKTPADSWDSDLRKSILLEKKDKSETKARPAKRKDCAKNKNNMIHKKNKYNARSMKSRDKRKSCERNRESNQEMEDTNEPEEDSQGTVTTTATTTTEKNHRVAAAATESRSSEKENIAKAACTNIGDSIASKPDKHSDSNDTRLQAPAKANDSSAPDDAAAEKKPVKKYAQLKTIRTNLRKSDSESKKSSTEEAQQINTQVSDLSRILAADGTQHILRMPDMITLETPRKFNASGVPPTPRVLSPSNLTTPFIKLSEDSSKMRSFISTPEFPKTPCIALTPKHAEETTSRDVAKRKSDYGTHESPILSSSHMKLHDSLTADNPPCQTCVSSKLEITQFEVIKENLPKEEAIKELKIASSSKDSASATELNAPADLMLQTNEFKDVDGNKHRETAVDDNYDNDNSSTSSEISSSSDSSSSSSSSSSTSTTDTSTTCSSVEKHDSATKSGIAMRECTDVATMQDDASANVPTDTCTNNPPSETQRLVNTAERCVAVEETLPSDNKQDKAHDQTDDKVSKLRQFVSHADKSKCILKCKVDQVKRDLFSDEENDQRTTCYVARNDKIRKIANAETQRPTLVEVPSTLKEQVNAENPKEELSTVLQCLQLVPAHKNEHVAHNDERQIEKKVEKQYQEENKHLCKGTSEVDGRSSNRAIDTHNYKAEYHFVYDDRTPVRKRRRRYSGHELQIKINYADLSDPNPVECIKIMRATEFEEIFNLPPKSKKRVFTKRASGKNEKASGNPKTDNDAFILKEGTTKPLASSSPLGGPSEAKTKIVKTVATNKTGNDAQPDAKKKLKLDKPQEKVSDIAGKGRKRKLSETKETKQIEKKQCATDPQTLLNNVDLNKFLSTVHGPE